jgi:hypothetical protein
MDNLTRFDNDGIEIFINKDTGESFASIRGVARMAEKNESTVRDFIGGRKIDVINVKVPTPGGLQGARLLSESSICMVLREYNPDRLEQFAMLGIRTVLYQIVGYTQQPVATPQPPIDIFNLDDRTMDLLEAWMHYRTFPSLEAIWEEYNHPDNTLEGFVSHDEVASLDERLKVITDAAYDYILGLWLLENMPYPKRKITKHFCTKQNKLAAQEFQAQLNSQLVPAASQQYLGAITTKSEAIENV